MKRCAQFTTVMMGILLIGFAVPAIAAPTGKTIASAFPVTYGQQEFGNTAKGQKLQDSCEYVQFWTLNVAAGDRLTINWGGSEETEMLLYAVGTTDYTVFARGNYPVERQGLNENGKNQMQYTAPVAGAMPLAFAICDAEGDPGPYYFVATIQHALVVSLKSVIRMRPEAILTGQASLADGTPAPDGLGFALTAEWQNNGRAQFPAFSAGGSLSFPVSLPPTAWGQTVTFVIQRSADAQYIETASSPMKVKVTGPPKVVQCVVPSLVGKKLKKAKRSLTRHHCRLGKVHKISGRKQHRVVRQKPKPGTALPIGSTVSVVIG